MLTQKEWEQLAYALIKSSSYTTHGMKLISLTNTLEIIKIYVEDTKNEPDDA